MRNLSLSLLEARSFWNNLEDVILRLAFVGGYLEDQVLRGTLHVGGRVPSRWVPSFRRPDTNVGLDQKEESLGTTEHGPKPQPAVSTNMSGMGFGCRSCALSTLFDQVAKGEGPPKGQAGHGTNSNGLVTEIDGMTDLATKYKIQKLGT